MTRKIFTSLFFSLLFSFCMHAQDPACIPEMITQDTSIILPEPYNFDDMTGGLDSTCAGLFYEQILTANVPATIPFAGQEFAIDSISIDLEGAIEGLPMGLDYACNPPSCVFYPETQACFVITGDVDAAAPAGDYDLTLRINAFNFLFPTGATITYPDDLGADNESYFINLSAADSCDIVSSTTFLESTIAASVSPNPTSTFTQLNIQSENPQDVQVMIIDVLGKVYSEQKINLNIGINTIPFDVQDLSKGIYFLSITNGVEYISQKLVVE